MSNEMSGKWMQPLALGKLTDFAALPHGVTRPMPITACLILWKQKLKDRRQVGNKQIDFINRKAEDHCCFS